MGNRGPIVACLLFTAGCLAVPAHAGQLVDVSLEQCSLLLMKRELEAISHGHNEEGHEWLGRGASATVVRPPAFEVGHPLFGFLRKRYEFMEERITDIGLLHAYRRAASHQRGRYRGFEIETTREPKQGNPRTALDLWVKEVHGFDVHSLLVSRVLTPAQEAALRALYLERLAGFEAAMAEAYGVRFREKPWEASQFQDGKNDGLPVRVFDLEFDVRDPSGKIVRQKGTYRIKSDNTILRLGTNDLVLVDPD